MRVLPGHFPVGQGARIKAADPLFRKIDNVK
jgi:hypothetical protein